MTQTNEGIVQKWAGAGCMRTGMLLQVVIQVLRKLNSLHKTMHCVPSFAKIIVKVIKRVNMALCDERMKVIY